MESGLSIGGVIAVIGLSFIASPAHAYDLETHVYAGIWTRIARVGGSGGELIPVVHRAKRTHRNSVPVVHLKMHAISARILGTSIRRRFYLNMLAQLRDVPAAQKRGKALQYHP